MDDETAKILGKILTALEMQRADIEMLSAVVTGLCLDASPKAREVAKTLLKLKAELPPKYVMGEQANETAKLGITNLASSWIAKLQ